MKMISADLENVQNWATVNNLHLNHSISMILADEFLPAIGASNNNNNNNNNHSLIYAHIYSRPTAQVHTVSKYMQI